MAIQKPFGPLVPGLNKQLNKLHDIPLIGPWAGRIGKVNRILGFPCNPSPEIIVEALVVSAIHAFLSLYTPSCIDYAASRFGREKPGGRHGAPGPGRTRKPKAGIDPFKVLPLKQIGISGDGGLFLLRAFELLRLVGFWLTVVDATTDGLVNWTSLAYQWSGCAQPGSEMAQAHLRTPCIFLFQNAWLPVTDWEWSGVVGVVGSQSGLYIPAHKAIHISWSVSSHPPPEIPGCDGSHCQFRLAKANGDVVQTSTSVPDSSTGGRISGNVLINDHGFDSLDQLRVEYFISGCGYAIGDSGHMTYTSASIVDTFKPQGSCPGTGA